MSKFTKRKNKSIQRYDKCPTMSLFQVATFLMKDANVNEKGISSVHLVKDDEARLTETVSSYDSDTVDVYITTKLLMLLLEEHAVNTDRNYSDRDSYLVTYRDGDTTNVRIPYAQRYYGRDNMGSKSIAIMCVDLLMYMKESGRVHIEVLSKKPLSCNSNGRVGYYRANTTNLRLTTSPCISQRLEITKVKNQLMEAHKHNTKTCNKIREGTDVNELINEHYRYLIPYSDKTKEGRKYTSIFVSYFVELGGSITHKTLAN